MAEPQTDTGFEERLEVIRTFNRMYMQRIGLLAENIFGSPFSPAEARVIAELSFKKATTASILARELKLDGGYLSRILHRFEKEGLISKEKSKEDGRQRNILLTKKGKKTGEDVLEEARKIITSIIGPLPVPDQIRLVAAMTSIDRIINRDKNAEDRVTPPPFTVRPHRTGDIGLIIHNHAVRFAEDYGFNSEFEALVAEKSAEFIRNFNPARERCWVAEIDGHLVGSVFLVDGGHDTGEMRLPFVAPHARGIGIGTSMLNEVIRFARHVGYKKMTMRTESILEYAVPLFEAAGLKIVRETPHQRFGKDVVGQDWEMAL
ncbi:MAG: MarR family transcriptional regulator [Alphaproteobacteria bacterium]|nr:MAG: MarR family transcriptional regulator [Alphaproteobacteria bacterium]